MYSTTYRKRKFVRNKRLCWRYEDFKKYSKILSRYFIKRGYLGTRIRRIFDDVKDLGRKNLLANKPIEIKYPQSIYACRWYSGLRRQLKRI